MFTVKRKEKKTKHYLYKYGLNEHIRITSVLYIHLFIHTKKKYVPISSFQFKCIVFFKKCMYLYLIFFLNIKYNNCYVFYINAIDRTTNMYLLVKSMHVLSGYWGNIMIMVQKTTAKEIVAVPMANKLDIVQKYKK